MVIPNYQITPYPITYLVLSLALAMHKTIYFNNKPLFITNEITKELEEYLHHDDTVYIDDFDFHTVKAMIHEMELTRIHAGVFLHDDIDAVLKTFKKKLKLIQAAGGLVYTDDHELLLIFRNQKWDLPKGKLDDGESLEHCAIREVEEETGLQKIKLDQPLTVTYHTYHQDGKHILKESHWYLMSGDSKTVLTPQVEEGIEKCEWVKIPDIAPYMENTHASILDVVNKAIKVLHEAKNV
jgi:8-oxo-dGTP pyrophosphatase MutT (NUDIX family)